MCESRWGHHGDFVVKDLLAGGLALGSVVLATGLLLVLLNARDRRRDHTASLVVWACSTPSLRGWIAVSVRAPLVRRRTVVVLDMSACSPDLVWPTLRCVAAVLPREIGLVIEDLRRRRARHANSL